MLNRNSEETESWKRSLAEHLKRGVFFVVPNVIRNAKGADPYLREVWMVLLVEPAVSNSVNRDTNRSSYR